MSSVSRVNGFSPVKHTNGSPYNGQANMYFTSTGDSTVIMVGDLVKLAGNARSASGVATVTRCAAGDIPVGVVVGFAYSGMGDTNNVPPVTDLNTPVYRRASTERYVMVADATDLVLEAQLLTATTFSVADVGLNISYDTAAGNTLSGSSGFTVDMSTVSTTNTLPLKLIGWPAKPDNVYGDTYFRVYVEFNAHSKKGTTGTTGI